MLLWMPVPPVNLFFRLPSLASTLVSVSTKALSDACTMRVAPSSRIWRSRCSCYGIRCFILTTGNTKGTNKLDKCSRDNTKCGGRYRYIWSFYNSFFILFRW